MINSHWHLNIAHIAKHLRGLLLQSTAGSEDAVYMCRIFLKRNTPNHGEELLLYIVLYYIIFIARSPLRGEWYRPTLLPLIDNAAGPNSLYGFYKQTNKIKLY